MNFTRYGACTKQLAGNKEHHFVALQKLYLYMILVSLKLDFAVRSYLLQNLISTTGSLATGKLCSHGDFQSKLVDSEQCLMVKGQCLEYLFENDDLQFELVQHIMSEHLNPREYLMQLVAGECLFFHTPAKSPVICAQSSLG